MIPARAKAIEMGVEDLLVKPVARASLRALVARIKTKAAAAPNPGLQFKRRKSDEMRGRHVLYAEDSILSQR